MEAITVFTARRILTMTEAMPEATAVAVRGGRIVEVGTAETLAPWLAAHDHRFERRFADKVILPGFIDPHLHPFIGAILLPCSFITAFEWQLPGRQVPAIRGRDAYLAALRAALAEDDGALPLFVTWGYHQLWHGEVTRADLNALSASRPILLWHRSFHEFVLNDAAIARLGIDEAVMARNPQIDAARGRFGETGALVAMAGLRPLLFTPEWFGRGLAMLGQVLHRGGLTCVADMAWGIFDFEREWQALAGYMADARPPWRCMMVPTGLPGLEAAADPQAGFERVRDLCRREAEGLFFADHVKFFADGALFSELMQPGPPGFIDGHQGEWITPPHALAPAMRPFWEAGWAIHVHCTGDLGLDLALDALAGLQAAHPRFDHRFTIEHFGMSTEEQVARLAALGAQVSANPWYLHELGERFAARSIGAERAHQMTRLGALARAGVPFALHSDFLMAPAEPLRLAWAAVTRQGESGATLCAPERITAARALRAITADAARMLGQEAEIGSIRAGKRADFTVLDDDPLAAPPEALADIGVHATVLGGVVHEVPR